MEFFNIYLFYICNLEIKIITFEIFLKLDINLKSNNQ